MIRGLQIMRKAATFILMLAILLLASSACWAKKTKTAETDGNLLTDNRYAYTFEKNDNWKFKTNKEKPDKPQFYRFEIQKKSVQMPIERRFSPETWTNAYGGFFVDTTSLNLEQFKALLIGDNPEHKQKKNIVKKAEIIATGEWVGEKHHKFGNLGPGYQLTFKEEYDVQVRDVKDNYNVITDYLMGDVYFAVDAGKVYGFFFTGERAEYRLCKIEIEQMLALLKFPGKDKPKQPPAPQNDSTTAEDK